MSYLMKLKEAIIITEGKHTVLRELLNPEKDRELPINYSIAHAIVNPGQKTTWHKLNSTEVFYFFKGKGKMYIKDTVFDIETGDTILVPAGKRQRLENITDEPLEMLCIVEPAWKKEDEIVYEELL